LASPKQVSLLPGGLASARMEVRLSKGFAIYLVLLILLLPQGATQKKRKPNDADLFSDVFEFSSSD
jgi:hypothetical protein